MGLEPLLAEAKRILDRGPQRATGAPSVGVAPIGFEFAAILSRRSSGRSLLQLPSLPALTGLPWIWTGLLGQTH